jgi:hypothetical protein
MPDPSNIRPVSAREILSRAATHLQMVDREAVSAKDAQHIGAAHSLLDLLLITEPVSFMPAQPVPSLSAGAGGNEVDALRDAAPDLLAVLKSLDACWCKELPDGPPADDVTHWLQDDTRAVWRAARAAIAKAEGGAA